MGVREAVHMYSDLTEVLDSQMGDLSHHQIYQLIRSRVMADIPSVVRSEHLDYLDNLRASGSVNMFGATDPLMTAFDLEKRDAQTILQYWMESFGNDNNREGLSNE